jgi:rod shape determining protein RodA
MLGSFTILQSITPALATYQLVNILIGILCILVVGKMNSDRFEGMTMMWYYLAVGALALTELFGVVSRGSARWLVIFGQQFQTSEIAKVLLILFAASWFSQNPSNQKNTILKFLGYFAVPCLLVFIQPDLGSALMIAGISVIAIIAAGVPFKYVALGIIGVASIIPIGISVLKPYQKDRLASFINPQQDPLGKGYNAMQATIAVGSGQLFGRGLGQGTQSHLKFLPERQTDFIFSSYVEELGFVGGSIVIILYCWLAASMIYAARHAKTLMQSLVVIIFAGHILLQAFVNMGMNMGIMPITGITLPLLSYGGSSLISTSLMIGCVVSIISNSKKSQTAIELR